MKLIDSPGFNDPDNKLTDPTISLHISKQVQALLHNDYEGLTGVVQCIMPNKGGRIPKSVV